MITFDYYTNNATQLIQRYDNADMSDLHKTFLKHIPKNSSVLDIGFGSGRDLLFLYENNYDIWGIDPIEEFVLNVKKKFKEYSEHFFQNSIPISVNLESLNNRFDAIVLIAVWMHLEHSKYEDTVKNIFQFSKENSIIIISYSQGRRMNDERCFEEVDCEYITKLFKNNGYSLVETIKTEDSLNRSTLSWKTVVFKR